MIRALLISLVLALIILPSHGAIFNHKSFILTNGLKVYFIHNALAPVVNVSLYYKVGTADDPRDQHGLSHFLEHMMFKGTTRVPKGKLDELLLQQGAAYNAHTTPDSTCYETTISKDQLELVLFLEADRMVNLTFDKKDVESERQVVHEERAMRLDNHPFGKATEIYLRSLYWKHPYGIPAIGYPEHIDAYTYDSVRQHYKTYYAPNNAILIIAGDTDFGRVKELAEKYFSQISPRSLPVRKRAQEPDHSDTTLSIDHYAERNHAISLQYSYQAPNFRGPNKEQAIPLLILSQIFSGNELSHLWKAFVDDEKIAVSVGSHYDHISIDPQTFDLMMTLGNTIDPKYAKKRMEDELQKFLRQGVSEEDVKNAKRDILAKLAFVKDGLTSTVQAFSHVVLGVNEDDLEHWDKTINAISKEDVDKALRSVFGKKPAVVLTLYPKSYEPYDLSQHPSKQNPAQFRSKLEGFWESLYQRVKNLFTL